MKSCVFIKSYDGDMRGPFTTAEEPLHAGPRAWRWLHLKALDKELTSDLLTAFTRCIHCPDCRRHFEQIQHDFPLEATDQFAWTVRAHNLVNASRGVRELTLEESRRLWTGPRKMVVSSSTPLVKFSNAVVGAL